jgi:hypothetical protein
MKTETVQFELPKEVMESAESAGFTREKLAEMSKSFTILEVLAATSKLDKAQATAISKKIKASAWKKTKRKLGL